MCTDIQKHRTKKHNCRVLQQSLPWRSWIIASLIFFLSLQNSANTWTIIRITAITPITLYKTDCKENLDNRITDSQAWILIDISIILACLDTNQEISSNLAALFLATLDPVSILVRLAHWRRPGVPGLHKIRWSIGNNSNQETRHQVSPGFSEFISKLQKDYKRLMQQVFWSLASSFNKDNHHKGIMKFETSHLFFLWTLITVLPTCVRGRQTNKSQIWGVETLGEEESTLPAEIETYKQNLLQYVLRTNEPMMMHQQAGRASSRTIPYIMDKLYNLLADKSTGKEKRSAPFEVDMIRGLEDHYG